MKTHHLLKTSACSIALIVSSVAHAQTAPADSDVSVSGNASEGSAPPPPAVALSGDPGPAPTTHSCTWAQRPCAYPHLVAGLDLGVSHLTEGNPFGFNTGTGSVTALGPAWGVRFGVEILPWFAVEAHYTGMYNRADASVSQGEKRGLLTSAGTAVVRFTVPTPFVEPYLFLGGGIYSTSVSGSSDTTELYGSTEFGMPLGVGFAIPLPNGLSLGAEVTYHRYFGESFSDNEDIGGADPVSATAVLLARF